MRIFETGSVYYNEYNGILCVIFIRKFDLQKVTFQKAREYSVRTARLPIQEYMIRRQNEKNYHSEILAINQGTAHSPSNMRFLPFWALYWSFALDGLCFLFTQRPLDSLFWGCCFALSVMPLAQFPVAPKLSGTHLLAAILAPESCPSFCFHSWMKVSLCLEYPAIYLHWPVSLSFKLPSLPLQAMSGLLVCVPMALCSSVAVIHS